MFPIAAPISQVIPIQGIRPSRQEFQHAQVWLSRLAGKRGMLVLVSYAPGWQARQDDPFLQDVAEELEVVQVSPQDPLLTRLGISAPGAYLLGEFGKVLGSWTAGVPQDLRRAFAELGWKSLEEELKEFLRTRTDRLDVRWRLVQKAWLRAERRRTLGNFQDLAATLDDFFRQEGWAQLSALGLVPKPPRAALGAPGGVPQGRRDERSGSTRFERDAVERRPPPQPGGTTPGGRSAASMPLNDEQHRPAGFSLQSIPPDDVAAHGGFGTSPLALPEILPMAQGRPSGPLADLAQSRIEGVRDALRRDPEAGLGWEMLSFLSSWKEDPEPRLSTFLEELEPPPQVFRTLGSWPREAVLKLAEAQLRRRLDWGGLETFAAKRRESLERRILLSAPELPAAWAAKLVDPRSFDRHPAFLQEACLAIGRWQLLELEAQLEQGHFGAAETTASLILRDGERATISAALSLARRFRAESIVRSLEN